ncbi:MAG: hypothetical protein NTY89_00055, partial [Nostocales cyanobacterium LacPavin_0920_SED1_MAG_38_18]|nr:hypothetical protein [Nostocales cyanobacterium LacPavin_0920_SED1_MAG_38_18]
LLIENVSESIFLSKICFFIDKCILLLIFHQFTSVITVCDSQGCGMWGKKVAEGFKETMEIFFDDFLPQWNYTAKPQQHLEL